MENDTAARHVGDLEIDVRTRQLSVAGRVVDLTTREFEILDTLTSHPEWVFSTDQLASQDARSYSSPLAVNVHISRLRGKLAGAGSTVSLLAVRGAGYRMRLSSGPASPIHDGSPFVGRCGEMGTLVAEMDEALARGVRVAFVVGEPGIGKTRCAEELGRPAAARGGVVLWGRSQLGKMPPYRPWAELLAGVAAHRKGSEEIASAFSDRASTLSPILSEVAKGAPRPTRMRPEQSRFMLFDSVTEVLTRVSRAKPLVLVLDDLQWAPEPSLALLDFFVRHADDARVLILALYRPEQARSSPLDEVLGGLMSHERCTCLSLEGLPADDVARLMSAHAGVQVAAGLVEAVRKLTGGNPFFVIELIRMITAADSMEGFDVDRLGSLIPTPNVLTVVRTRVDGLSPGCRELVEVGAIVGALFSPELVARVVGTTPTTALGILEEALSAGFLMESDSPCDLRFSHGLVQQVVYRDIPVRRRVILHGRVGDALRERSVGSDSSVAALADHYCHAAPSGYGREAMEYTLAAARQAMAHAAFESAVTGLRRGLDLLETTDMEAEERRNWHLALQEALGDSLAAAAQLEQSGEAYQTALRDSPDSHRVLRARLHGKLAVVAMQQRQLPYALGLTELAQDCLAKEPEEEPPGEWWPVWCESEANRMRLYYFLGMPEEFDERVHAYRARFEKHANPALRSEYTNWLLLRNLWRDRYVPSQETVRLVRRHYQEAQAAGLSARLHAAQLAGTTLGWAGELDEAEERLMEVIRLSERTGDPGMKLMALANLSTISRLRGDSPLTRERAERCIEWGGQIGATGDLTATSMADLSWVALREGDYTRARLEGAEASALMRRHNPRFPGRLLGGWPVIAASLATEDLACALEHAEDLLDPTQMALDPKVRCEIDSALAAGRSGDLDTAADALQRAVELVRPVGYT